MQDVGDGVSSTSDGVFVNVGNTGVVSVGDEVAVSGVVSDNYANTQIAVNAVSDMVSIRAIRCRCRHSL